MSLFYKLTFRIYFPSRGQSVILSSVAMLSRFTAVVALAGSAAAFSPMMSMDLGRREVSTARSLNAADALANLTR